MVERLRATLPPRFDLLLAGVVAVLGQLQVWAPLPGFGNITGPLTANALAYLLASTALAWRRQSPVAVLAIVTAILSGDYLLFGASEGLGAFLPPLVAIYSVGRYADTRAVLVAGPLALLGTAIHELCDPAFVLEGSAAMYWAILVAAWPIGQALHSREAHARSLAERAATAEVQRQEQARLAVADERARIARELHDMVGHSVSVIAMQAMAADALLERGTTDGARQRLQVIEEAARQSLAEMRRLVGLLDSCDHELPLTPQSTLACLDALLEQVRGAGLPVELKVEGCARTLPPGVDLAAYRIIQEALTNTLKHAGPARATVTIRHGKDDLAIDIVDDGRGSRAGQASGSRGLIGMRERAALYGGQLRAEPQPEGGFVVSARLPLRDR